MRKVGNEIIHIFVSVFVVLSVSPPKREEFVVGPVVNLGGWNLVRA